MISQYHTTLIIVFNDLSYSNYAANNVLVQTATNIPLQITLEANEE